MSTSIDKSKDTLAGSSFFALTSRMKYINRWGLMRNSRSQCKSRKSRSNSHLPRRP